MPIVLLLASLGVSISVAWGGYHNTGSPNGEHGIIHTRQLGEPRGFPSLPSFFYRGQLVKDSTCANVYSQLKDLCALSDEQSRMRLSTLLVSCHLEAAGLRPIKWDERVGLKRVGTAEVKLVIEMLPHVPKICTRSGHDPVYLLLETHKLKQAQDTRTIEGVMRVLKRLQEVNQHGMKIRDELKASNDAALAVSLDIVNKTMEMRKASQDLVQDLDTLKEVAASLQGAAEQIRSTTRHADQKLAASFRDSLAFLKKAEERLFNARILTRKEKCIVINSTVVGLIMLVISMLPVGFVSRTLAGLGVCAVAGYKVIKAVLPFLGYLPLPKAISILLKRIDRGHFYEDILAGDPTLVSMVILAVCTLIILTGTVGIRSIMDLGTPQPIQFGRTRDAIRSLERDVKRVLSAIRDFQVFLYSSRRDLNNAVVVMRNTMDKLDPLVEITRPALMPLENRASNMDLALKYISAATAEQRRRPSSSLSSSRHNSGGSRALIPLPPSSKPVPGARALAPPGVSARSLRARITPTLLRMTDDSQQLPANEDDSDDTSGTPHRMEDVPQMPPRTGTNGAQRNGQRGNGAQRNGHYGNGAQRNGHYGNGAQRNGHHRNGAQRESQPQTEAPRYSLYDLIPGMNIRNPEARRTARRYQAPDNPSDYSSLLSDESRSTCNSAPPEPMPDSGFIPDYIPPESATGSSATGSSGTSTGSSSCTSSTPSQGGGAMSMSTMSSEEPRSEPMPEELQRPPSGPPGNRPGADGGAAPDQESGRETPGSQRIASTPSRRRRSNRPGGPMASPDSDARTPGSRSGDESGTYNLRRRSRRN